MLSVSMRTLLRRSLPRTSRMAPLSLFAKPTLVYTETDEAPALATYSLLPIVATYAGKVGIDVVKSDISLSSRIISQFPKYLSEEQKMI
ncbi:monomeric isocitrate dehydrogenase-domain-containing protein [Ochromonadaceae sp. CCMP2298]|nr:monomeric isocitrate dehydrogenase-domain-containing protein [Ochromonadaceae sp. CCMP2298]